MAFVMLAAELPGHSLLIRDAAAALPMSPQRDLILASVDRWLRDEGRPCAVSFLDAAGISGSADAGFRGVERCGCQGEHSWNDPLSRAECCLTPSHLW
jgi:hypothetical protein